MLAYQSLLSTKRHLKEISLTLKKGKKLYFKRSELDEWHTENKISTNAEIEAQAMTYIMLPKRNKNTFRK